jgi:hypothetical protein
MFSSMLAWFVEGHMLSEHGPQLIDSASSQKAKLGDCFLQYWHPERAFSGEILAGRRAASRSMACRETTRRRNLLLDREERFRSLSSVFLQR